MAKQSPERDAISPIPVIICPRCGKQMRLAEVDPEPGDTDRLIFDCDCGFEYQMSQRVRKDR
jgi:hypothetical protein